jgi:hypothetical protein
MRGGLFNPFFQNGVDLTGQNGYSSQGGAAFDEAYQAVLTRAAAIPTSNLPSSEGQIKGNRLIESLKRGGAGWAQAGIDLFDHLELMYVPSNDASDKVFGRINWVTPGTFDSTEVGGAMTKVENGGIYGTSTIYATTGWKPLSNKVKIGAADLSMIVWVADMVGGVSGVETDSTNRFRLLTTDYGVNSGRDTHSSITDNGFHMINSDGSGNIFKWTKGGRQRETAAGVFGTLSDLALPITASNVNGTVTGRTTKVLIYLIARKLYTHELAVYGCLDEYVNGVWPFTKLSMVDITPSVVGVKDYPAFPDFLVGRVGSNTGKYFWSYKKSADHNVATDADEILRISTDKGATWTAEQSIVTEDFSTNFALSGTSGTMNVTVAGVDYLSTFNTSLTQTAADFVSTHGAALTTAGYTALQLNNTSITIIKNDHTAIVASKTQLTGNLNATQGAGIEVVDNALGESEDGTILYFYSTNYVQNSWIRRLFVKRSTDGGSTFGSPIEITTDFSPNGQIAGPGGSITLANGRILKAVYATSAGSGTRRCYAYYSDDDGLTWAQLSVMSATDASDFEEPSLRLLPNGNILGLLRSDPLDATYYVVSTDSGATWSAEAYQSPSTGKNPIAVNPDGTIISIGRWPGSSETNVSRTMISYADQDDLTNWRHLHTDEDLGWYMYAGADWDAESNCFVHIDSVEVSNNLTGATKMRMFKWG